MSLDGSGNLGETPGELDILAGISRPASRQSLKAVNTVRVADEGGADNAAQYGIAGPCAAPGHGRVAACIARQLRGAQENAETDFLLGDRSPGVDP